MSVEKIKGVIEKILERVEGVVNIIIAFVWVVLLTC